MIEVLKQALEALENSIDMVRCDYETNWRHGLPTRKAQLDGMKEMLEQHEKSITFLRQAIAEAEKQEPVAWMHNHIKGNVIAHRPVTLDRHPEHWTALYPEPKPCPTCEALARTVMLDQTSHDAPPQRQPQQSDFEEYCKTLHPLWNSRISRTEAEGFFHAGWLAAHGIKGEA